MITAPTADRYSLALRRGRLWCGSLALLGALLYPTLAHVGRRSSTAGRLAIAYDAPSVNLVKFPKDLFSTTGSFQNDVATLSSSDATDAARSAAGTTLDIGLSPDSTTRTLLLTVTGSSTSATDRGFDALVGALRDARRKGLGETVAEFDRSVARMKPIAQARVKELDEQIGSVSPADSVLAQALQAERAIRTDDLLQLDGQRAVLDGYASDPNAQVTVTARSHPAIKSELTVGNVLIGAVLGSLVAVVGIVLRTFFRRRIHTRSDVARLLGGVPVLSLPEAADDVDQVFVRRLVMDAAGRTDRRLTMLTDPVSPELTERLRRAWAVVETSVVDPPTVTIEPWSFPISGAGAQHGALGDVALVLRWGVTRETSVVSVAAGADAIGGAVRAVAIAGVPVRYHEQAGL